MTSSPLIQAAESLYSLPNALSALGYNSVFDVVRLPRERFVRQHRDNLGRNAGKMYDLLIGYALQVANQRRHNRPVRAINIAAQGPFSRSGPDYPTQFLDAKTGWLDRAPSGSPEANDGPVAYLAYIYGQVQQQEKQLNDGTSAMNTLKQRRPDIGSLLVNDAAINEAIPQIQLVNEVLASAVQAARKLNDVNDVNTLLATTRYPNTLPYHYPNQQILAAQSALGIDLWECLLAQDIALLQGFWTPTGTTLSDTQASDLGRFEVNASQLAPEQQNIVAEPAPASFDAQFYLNNFGSGGLTAASFSSMDVLTSRTGLTVPEVEQMFCATAGGATAFTVVLSDNVTAPASIKAVPFAFGARFIHDGAGPSIYLEKDSDDTLQVMSLTDDRLGRINRMVRLQKWLGLPFEDVDLLITSTMVADGLGMSMSDNTLRTLGVFNHYQKMYGVSAKQFSASLCQVTPYSITPETPFFDQIFNSSKAFDTPLLIDGQVFDPTATSGADAVIVQKICASLGLGRQEFLMIAESVPSVGQGKLACDLVVTSSFYRVASLARALSMSVQDFWTLAQLLDQGTGAVLKQLAGAPVVSLPQKGAALTADFLTLLQVFSHISSWLQERKLSVSMVSAMVMPITAVQQANDYQVAFVQEVCQQLASTYVDPTQFFKLSGAPLVRDDGEPIDWGHWLVGSGMLIDPNGLITDRADDTQNEVTLAGEIPIIVGVVVAVQQQHFNNADVVVNAMQFLTEAVFKARQVQTSVVSGALAKMLDVPPSLSILLFQWVGQKPYDWLIASVAAKAQADLGGGVPLPVPYLQTLGEIARRALLCQQLSLSAAALQYLLANPDKFGLPSPYDGQVTLFTLYVLGRYDDFLHRVGAEEGGTEDDILAYLKIKSADNIGTDVLDGLLAKLLGWDVDQLKDGWPLFGGNPASSVPQLDAVLRLQQAQQDTGLTVSQQQQAFALDRNSEYDAWRAVGQAMIAGANHVKGLN